MNYTRKISKDGLNYIILIVCVVIFSFLGLNTSPGYKGLPDIDSSVFQVIGRGLAKGQIIYKDLFDHKGPIMYLINMIGYIINPRIGLFFIEVASMYIGTIYIYKISKMLLDNKNIQSIIVCLIYLSSAYLYIYGGNYTEEYAITFLSMGMYYILKILYKNEYDKKRNWILIGATFAINVFIKPTYISIWVAFGIVQLFYSINEKKLKELLKYIMYMSIGIAVVTFPILIYLVANNNLNDFFDAYILMNAKYSKSNLGRKLIVFLKLIKVQNYYLFMLIIYFGNAMIITSKNKKNKIKFLSIAFTIISLILLAWAPNRYNHYLIQVSPCVALTSIFIIEEFDNLKIKVKDLPINFIYITIIIFILFITAYKASIQMGVFSDKVVKNKEEINDINEVKSLLNDEDEILVLGNNSWYYLKLEKQPKCKYFFQFPIIIYNNKEISSKIDNYIKANKPRMLIQNKDLESKRVLKAGGIDMKNYSNEYEKYETNFFEYYVLKEN